MPDVLLTHTPVARDLYYGERALAALRAVADVRLHASHEPLSPRALIEAADGCDIVVADRLAAAPRAFFDALPSLVAFVRCAVDIRNVDVPAATARGVLVTRASAGFQAAVSEWIVGAMIDLARGLTAGTIAYRKGETLPLRRAIELRGATLGIVGYGRIARYLAPVARALGMRVVVHDPDLDHAPEDIEARSLDALLAEADFVVCLAAATEATENLMDRAAFARMRSSAYFVNASRGDLVDEAALIDALDGGTIAGCALDVGRAPDQLPSPALARHPKVIATPHVGGLTTPAVEHQSLETVRQVRAIVEGRIPDGAVNDTPALRLRRAAPG